MSTQKNDENEFLATLIEQFGLDKLGKFDSRRNVIWKEITEEFNHVTGQERSVQQMRDRWKNYR